MMISISVAIASDYLAGNFAAWGRGSSVEPTRIVRSGEVEREEAETEPALLINKLRLEIFTAQSHKGTVHKLT